MTQENQLIEFQQVTAEQFLKSAVLFVSSFSYLVYMSPAKWIRQAEWIKIANIHYF